MPARSRTEGQAAGQGLLPVLAIPGCCATGAVRAGEPDCPGRLTAADLPPALPPGRAWRCGRWPPAERAPASCSSQYTFQCPHSGHTLRDGGHGGDGNEERIGGPESGTAPCGRQEVVHAAGMHALGMLHRLELNFQRPSACMHGSALSGRDRTRRGSLCRAAPFRQPHLPTPPSSS